MKSTWKRILPILLVIVILLSIGWYLFDYDREFTRDALLYQARFFEEHGRTDLAEWFYNQAYRHSDDSAAIAIELAQRFKAAGNYTRAEYTLSGAIADHPSQELYIALCKTYVEQDKLLDAVTMLDSISDSGMKAQMDALRPAAPAVTPAPGYYSHYVSLEFDVPPIPESDGFPSASNSVAIVERPEIYVSVDGEYPSVKEDLYTDPIVLKAGENTVYALAVDKNGLVSPLSILGYTIGGVVEPVEFVDKAIEEVVRKQLEIAPGTTLMTNDLWSITAFTLPAGAKADDLHYFSNLTELTVNKGGNLDFSVLSSLPKLEKLTVTGTNISTGTLEVIASLPNLKELTLTSCGLSNIRALSQAKNLVYLDLGSNAIRDITPLSSLEKLTDLNLAQNALTDLSALSGLSKLIYLDVTSNSLASVAPLASCTQLLKLDIGHNSVGTLTGLEQLTKLMHLDASYNALTEVDILANHTDLVELNISDNTVLDITCLSKLTKLRSFLFARNEIGEIPDWGKDCDLVLIDGSSNALLSIETLRGYKNLNTVRMDYNFISEVNFLAECPNMIQVDVSYNPIQDVSKLQEQSIIVHYTPELAE